MTLRRGLQEKPNVAMHIVAERHAFVIGVDIHSLALDTGATGRLVKQGVFPNSPTVLIER